MSKPNDFNLKPILIVDFDGTICTHRYWRSVSPEINTQIQTLMFGQDTKIVHDWMRGKYTAEEINTYVAEKLSLDYQELWELFVIDCQTMFVPQEILNVVNSLRNKYITILMTGNMDSFSRFTVPSLKLDQYFDYISNSYEEGKHKTDDEGSLFTDWAKKLEVPIETCALIDDNNNCCEVFSKLGGVAYKAVGLDNTLEILTELQQK